MVELVFLVRGCFSWGIKQFEISCTKYEVRSTKYDLGKYRMSNAAEQTG